MIMKLQLFTLLFCCVILVCPLNSFAQNNEPIEQDSEYVTSSKMKTRFSFGGGYAHRLGKTMKTGNSQMDDITKGLKSGFNLDLEFQCFKSEYVGFGLYLNYASATGKSGGLDETDRFIYVGPTYSLMTDYGKFVVVGNIGLGPIFFNANSNSEFRSLNKVAVGLQTSVSAEYKVSPRIGLGLKLNIIAGSIKAEGIGEDDRLNLSNLTIGGFISFRSW